MGDTYTRQSSYTDGDVITAAHTNNEFNQLLAAFAASTGHTHDGTAAEGGPITKLLGNTLTFGAGTAGTDITITFDGETSDGELKWMEDEDYFEFSDDILVASTEKVQFGDTASFIQQSSDGVLRIDGEATVDINASTAVLVSNDLKLDSDAAVLGFGVDNDVTLTHVADTALLLNSSRQLQFGDSGTYIHQSADGVLDLVADTEIEINATTIDINGNVDISGTLTIGSAGISEAELEILDGATVTTTELNILDGDTSATSTTVADADRVVFNDAGTMKQVAVTDLAAYFDDEITAMPNLVTTGALDSGSITSGFGTIDTGSSTITTTGLITGGSLDIDDVVINGSTIGHTDDTDLITVANGIATVAGEISVTTLDIGGTNVTSTAAELNILDGVTATAAELNYSDTGAAVGTVVASKVVTVDSNKDVASFRNITLTGELDAGSLDVSGDADIDGTLEADAITVNGTALNTVIAGVTVTDATNSAHVLVTDNESTNEENLITFVEDATSSTGNVGLEMDGNLTYNPSTGTITATIFKGNIDAVDGDFDGTLEADAITLNGTAITATATLDTGISNNNVPKFTSGVADNDFLRVDGTAIEGRSASEVLSDISAAPAAGDSNIVTTGALNSGSITSGFGAINNGSSAITTTGTMTFGSLSDGSITVTAFVDEDDMSSNSATLIPTQQSVKAYVDNNAGSFNSFFIEDDDGTEVTIDNAKELKFIGSGITTNFTDTSTGSDGDPFDLTFTVDAAQTGINSIKNTSLVIGRDDDNLIKFSTDNQIIFEVSGGDNVIFKASGEIEASSLDISGDIDVDGTTNLDVVDIDGAVDMASTLQVDGSITSSSNATISTTGNSAQLTLKTTDADSSVGPLLLMQRDSSSPANSDLTGKIEFNAEDSGGNNTEYASINTIIRDVTDGSESGELRIDVRNNGTNRQALTINNSEIVVNDASVDVDFRVESNGAANMLFVDGGNDAIGINTNSPLSSSKLHIFEATRNGSYAINGSRDSLIIEDSQHAGMSICGGAGNSGTASIAFPNGSSNIDGLINYNLDSRFLSFHSADTEAARFDSSRTFLVGKTSDSFGTDGVALKTSGEVNMTRTNAVVLSIRRNGNEGDIIEFYEDANSEGSIAVSTSGVTYNTTSDIRLKENIEPLKATDKLMQMNPVSYNWKSDPDGPRNVGFIAQEMQKIVPESVNISEDKNKTMGMDYGRITPILVSALQDAHKKIEELESRIAAMESK